ncbi:PfkB family carbohydrate kinase [Actinoplanes sp. URMC 104]|uniref:PfkB family carbohydrate kinase n=1 Tax=Actinoplanes sp. URMC 104 TaxID=3423409 RepID=UPI003F1AAF69
MDVADASGGPTAAGPDPRRVRDLPSLARELALLAARAARGSGRRQISQAELTRRLGLPSTMKSTINSYFSGKSLAPPDTLDAIVIALGATPEDQRLWSEAWERVNMQRLDARRGNRPAVAATGPDQVVAELRARLDRTRHRLGDVLAVSAHNMDTLIRVPKIVADDEIEIARPTPAPGGSGANTMVGLSRLGIRVSVAGAVADDENGMRLRSALAADGVNTEHLLTISEPGLGSGSAYVLTEHAGARSIYPYAGVNNRLAAVVADRGLVPALRSAVAGHRILHLSSFVGSDERRLQESLVASVDDDTIVSFTPGSLYAKLGGDRLASILRRANLLFMYEQQLDQLLRRTNLGAGSPGHRMEDQIRTLFSWRAAGAQAQPLILVVKRPAELVAGSRRDYVAVAFGRTSMEGFAQPDGELSHHDILDATGAGDALAAGILFALLRGAPPGEAANFAYVMALSASSGVGARTGLPDTSTLAEHWRRHLPASPLPRWLGLA